MILGLLHHFFGVEVHWDADGLLLSQSKYMHEILHDSDAILQRYSVTYEHV